MPSIYLGKFWKSIEITLKNCEVEFKLKCTKFCVFSVAGNENIINDNNANDTSNDMFL